MMPPADRIREQNEQDPGRVAHTRQEAGSNDFPAVCPALHVLQLNVEGLCSQVFHHPGHSRETVSNLLHEVDDDAVILVESTALAIQSASSLANQVMIAKEFKN